MSTDFKDASARHFDDALLLEANARTLNADQLFAFSAECSLKAVLIGLGLPSTRAGAPLGYVDHIDNLWVKFQMNAQGLLASHYLALLPPSNPFGSWTPAQRYFGRSTFSAPQLAQHKTAAQDCLELLRQLELDGVI